MVKYLFSDPSQNWLKNLTSFSYKSLMSSISYLRRAILSRPTPNAKPVYSLGSIWHISSTWGWTMPHPRISIHPSFLQNLHPFPPHIAHWTSISTDGSVNGKKLLLYLVGLAEPEGHEAEEDKHYYIYDVCRAYAYGRDQLWAGSV